MRESDKRTILRDVVIITFLALLLRVSGNLSSSFFFDEAVYADYGRHPLWTQFYATVLDPPVLPLLAFLIRTFAGPSELLFRLPSIIVGCATVALTYLLGRQVSGRSVGLVSAALLALNTLHQQYSQAATTHVYLTFYTVLALYGVARRNTLIACAGLLGALYTNDLSLLLLAAYALLLGKSEGVKGAVKKLSPLLLLYVPRIPVLIEHFFHEAVVRSFVETHMLFYVEAIMNHASLALVLGFLYCVFSCLRIKNWRLKPPVFDTRNARKSDGFSARATAEQSPRLVCKDNFSLSSEEDRLRCFKTATLELYLTAIFVLVSPFLLYFQRYALFVIPAVTVASVSGWVMFYERHVRQYGRKALYAAGVLFALLLCIPNPHAYGVYPRSSAHLDREDMIDTQQWREAANEIDGGVVLVSQNKPSLVYYLEGAGKNTGVEQFDSKIELEWKLMEHSPRWVVVRNFPNGFEDYENMIAYMNGRSDYTLEREWEYLLLFKKRE